MHRLGPGRDSSYLTTFVPLQILINEAYLSLLDPNRKMANVLTYRTPFPEYLERPVSGLPDFAPVTIVFGFILTIPVIVRRIIDERVSKSRQLLQLAGLNSAVYWLATFIDHVALFVTQAVVISALFVIKFNGVTGLASQANPVVVFVTLLAYGMAFVTMSAAVAIPFTKPTAATIVVVVLWLVTFVVPEVLIDPFIVMTIDIEKTQLARLLTSCIFPNMGITFALRLVLQKEIYASGATFYNFFHEVGVFGYFTLGAVLIAQLINTLINFLIIWFLDAVFVHQKSLLFPFAWLFRKTVDGAIELAHSVDRRSKRDQYIERPTSNFATTIDIMNVVKEFGTGANRKTAVNSLSLKVRHGEVTVVLGDNGAGKSTTINMITGLLAPTSGSILINGVDVREDGARKSLALCPQKDILFGDVTVKEHVQLYAAIKGCDQIEPEVDKTLSMVGLSEVKDRLASALSGGMKRKLSLAIALVNNTQVR